MKAFDVAPAWLDRDSSKRQQVFLLLG